jgi:hypothetical protein
MKFLPCLVTEDKNGKADGCYLAYDSDRHRFFRPGASCSNKGMIGRWKEHERASRLMNDETQWRAFDRCFPHQSVANFVPDRMGTFDRIEQRMPLGFYKSDMKRWWNYSISVTWI